VVQGHVDTAQARYSGKQFWNHNFRACEWRNSEIIWVSGVVLSRLPEVYILYGEDGGIRTQVSQACFQLVIPALQWAELGKLVGRKFSGEIAVRKFSGLKLNLAAEHIFRGLGQTNQLARSLHFLPSPQPKFCSC
jgi:hypothetical protein